ncbi:MAG: sigma-70 family RNA polymerase sigma factor [Candidatus Aminicenantes bacterium]|nr:sigma-70 family RNA polymerase sigma factor [Candidatus Aminicenantes bacterium]
MKQPEKNEEQMLIANAKNGSIDAFETLVRKHQKSIYYLCWRMTGAHQSADDLSQETFVKAYLALSRFKEKLSFFSWLRKIAINSSLNYLKKREKEVPLDERMQLKTSNTDSHNPNSPANQLRMNELDTKLMDSMEKLPAEQRSVFVLKVFEGMKYKEISDHLNIPLGTVMSRLNRARERLKSSLSGFLEEGHHES